MPNKRGRNTYKGYKSPATGGHSKKYSREVRHVYGACRQKNPGESQAAKAKCARIAHSTAKKKYGH